VLGLGATIKESKLNAAYQIVMVGCPSLQSVEEAAASSKSVAALMSGDNAAPNPFPMKTQIWCTVNCRELTQITKFVRMGKEWSFKGFDGSELEGRSIRSGRGVIH
jgi:hypothetical protein